MLVYEVNLEVDQSIEFAFAGWLPEHIQKVLDVSGFKAAYWYFRKPEDEGSTDQTKKLWTVHYFAESREQLDQYFEKHAQKIRQEAKDRFGDKYKANRRVLHLLSAAGLPAELAQEQAAQSSAK